MSLNVTTVAAEMQRYVVQNKKVTHASFAKETEVRIDSYCQKVTKIKGVYQTLHALMTHVVQGFRPQWDALGQAIIADMEHKSFRQKINFEFTPAAVLGTVLADWHDETKKPTDQDIAKLITQWVIEQAKDDIAFLSIAGERDNAKAHGQFGYSMDGWNKIVKRALADTTDNPVYKIPSDVITSANIVSVLRNFEKKFPKILKSKIKEIHMSTNNLEMYAEAYEEAYKNSPSFDEQNAAKSPTRKRKLIGHDDLADDVIFATVDGNMLKLIDILDKDPVFNDVQTQDYKVKLFGEFERGYSLLLPQATCVMDFTGNVLGLGDAVKEVDGVDIPQMELYYPHEVVEAPVVIPGGE